MLESVDQSAQPKHSSVAQFLTNDHQRLDTLLSDSLQSSGEIDTPIYDEFRRGILRHIGIEEKLLLPYAKAGKDDGLVQLATTLRLHHGAIAALLVLNPAPAVLRALHNIFAIHNPLEEGANGFYERCERLAASEIEMLQAAVDKAPEVPLAIRAQSSLLFDAARRALVRAGFPETLLDA